jgi:L-lactate dehydrogenase (cytochrome)
MADVPPQFANYQYEIYLRGMADERPALPIAYDELEAAAVDAMSAEAVGYVVGGAGGESTVRANRAAFERWRIVPRMLRDVGERDLSTTVLGTDLPAPVMLAPVGVQSIVHPEGELATARGAAAAGVPIVLSSVSSHAMEDVAEAMGEVPRWFQLYWPRDRELAASFLSRAEAAGFGAVVVTLDTAILAWRPRDLSRGYLPFLKGEGLANYFSDPVFRAALEKPPEEDLQAAVLHWVAVYSDPTVNWDDLGFLRESTSLPIVLKGIVHPDDARRAADAGIDGVLVSNHGGRQVDGAIATLEALPGIVEAVPDEFPVLLDSGVRTAADAFKALALGASAVALGRQFVWALGLGGEAGVRQVLQGFLAELDLTFALSGVTSPADLGPDALTRV